MAVPARRYVSPLHASKLRFTPPARLAQRLAATADVQLLAELSSMRPGPSGMQDTFGYHFVNVILHFLTASGVSGHTQGNELGGCRTSG